MLKQIVVHLGGQYVRIDIVCTAPTWSAILESELALQHNVGKFFHRNKMISKTTFS